MRRRALLLGRISTFVEPLLRHPQAYALHGNFADKGAVRDVSLVENNF